MKHYKPNGARGIIGLVGISLVVFSAGNMWGFSAGLFALGAILYIDICLDDAIERISGISRWPKRKAA